MHIITRYIFIVNRNPFIFCFGHDLHTVLWNLLNDHHAWGATKLLFLACASKPPR